MNALTVISTDLLTPLGAYLRLREDGRASFLLESVEKGRLGRHSFVGCGSRIVTFDRPRSFRDSMVSGAFARFDHDHFFEPESEGTRMVDVFDFAAPLGPLGRVVDCLILARYMRRLVEERALSIKRAAESDEWKALLR